jgi:ribonuclease P protein component
MPEPKTFPKALRLRSPQQFANVYASGIYAADQTLVINLLANGLTTSRMGLSIPKLSGDAPTRNKWKRYCREAFRLQQHDLPVGIDFVVRPRKGAKPVADSVANSLKALLCRGATKLEAGS